MKDKQNPVNLAGNLTITILTNFRADVGVEKAIPHNRGQQI